MKKLFQMFGRWGRPRMRLQVMADGEKEARFGEIPASRLWPAVMAELDEFAVMLSDRAATEDELNVNRVFKHLGGQEALLEFKERLLQRETDAHGRLAQQSKEAEEAEEAGTGT